MSLQAGIVSCSSLVFLTSSMLLFSKEAPILPGLQWATRQARSHPSWKLQIKVSTIKEVNGMKLQGGTKPGRGPTLDTEEELSQEEGLF